MSVNVKGTCVPKQRRDMLSLPLQCHLASSDAARTQGCAQENILQQKAINRIKPFLKSSN